MTETEIAVRRAGRDDHEASAGVLARAFVEDPIYVWTFPDRRRRERSLPLYMRSVALTMFGSLGPVEVAVADGDVVGVMVRAEPGHVGPSWLTTLRALPGALGSAGPAGLARVVSLDRAVSAVRPAEPHRYLFHLGSDPGWQGCGVGSALLESALRASDADGAPTYLECKPAIIPYYERFGFEVTRPVPLDQVELCGMLRPSRTD